MHNEQHAGQAGIGGSIADAVGQNLNGQLAGNHLLQDLKGIPDQDLLHARLQAVLLTEEPERLRAFCRTLQKRLEQAMRERA